jgi:hypothetical protein|tara:strand:+ start:1370 stop:1987 length:618 start_codon:yes stop_codon:yes gene_type:complete
MAITFRGQASRLNKETKGRNQVGFQDKSAAGDRQGVGGEDVSLKQAMGSFNKRNTSPAKKIGPQGLGVKGNNGYSVGSPAKIKKNFYGGEAYFQDGYGGDLGSPAKKSCSPITARAKNSPLKMNQALVDGAGQTGKKFVDAGSEVAKAFTTLSPEPAAANLKSTHFGDDKKKENKKKEVNTLEGKGIDIKATNPMDDMEAPTLEF